MHDSSPTFSVVMPIYNADETLNDAIQSIATQSDSDWELILVDDGSSDNSWEIARDWEEKDSRIYPVKNPGKGIVDALNFGLEQSSGPWIVRMDSDDISRPERLSRTREWIVSHPDIDIFSCLIETFPEITDGMAHYMNWLNNTCSSEDIRRSMYIESPIAHPSAIVRAAALQEIHGYRDGNFPEDYDLWLRLHHHGFRFLKVPEILFDWRESPGRLSRVDERYSLDAFRALKATHLANSVIQKDQEVQIWGAGDDGKKWRKALLEQNIEVVRFFDVDPRKIGGRIAGTVPVLHWEEIKNYQESTLTLGAVGSKGARSLMRKALPGLNLIENENFLFVQ